MTSRQPISLSKCIWPAGHWWHWDGFTTWCEACGAVSAEQGEPHVHDGECCLIEVAR